MRRVLLLSGGWFLFVATFLDMFVYQQEHKHSFHRMWMPSGVLSMYIGYIYLCVGSGVFVYIRLNLIRYLGNHSRKGSCIQ